MWKRLKNNRFHIPATNRPGMDGTVPLIIIKLIRGLKFVKIMLHDHHSMVCSTHSMVALMSFVFHKLLLHQFSNSWYLRCPGIVKHQVGNPICIQNFIHQSFFCIFRYYIHCNFKKQWRQHRSLMYANLHQKFFR